MDIYDELAELYDLIYSGDFDIEFYEDEAKKLKGPVLEIGCGTGRVLLELLKKGIDIEGLDISKEMLKILKSKAKLLGLKPKVYKADMRKFSLKKKYSMIIVPYRSFLHLSTDKDRVAALKNMYNHLKKGGKLIIHVYNPSDEELEPAEDFKPIDLDNFDLDGEKFTAFWFMRYSKIGKKAEYLIELHDKTKKVKEFKMSIYFIGYDKMKKLLGKAGFKNTSAYSDFTLSFFTPGSGAREVVWVAEK